MRRTDLLLLPFLGLLLAFVGCSSSTSAIPTVELAGTVTLDKVPVKSGFIIFYSDIEGGPQVSAVIKDGKFEEKMVPQGQYKAAVKSGAMDKPDGPVTSGTATPTAAKADPLPLKYREPTIPVDASKDNLNLVIELTSKP